MLPNRRWFQIATSALAGIGLIAVLAAGGFGFSALLKTRHQVPDSRAAVADVVATPGASAETPPVALPPPPGFAMAAAAHSISRAQPGPEALRTETEQNAGATTPKATDNGSRTLPSGRPDLSVSIVDTGILAGGEKGEFRHADAVNASDYPAVLFEVANIGTAVSDQWEFSATLPTIAGFFNSETQPKIAPGDRIRYTLGFRPISRPEGTVVITVDPHNRLRDPNRANDTARTVFTLAR